MPHTNSHIAREPVAYASGVTIVVTLAALLGLDLDPKVAGAIVTVVVAVGGWWARRRVTPVGKHRA